MVPRKTKSYQFLRSCIFEALMLLMDEKDYDDIAISEIAAKAGVSRMTYYRTYSSKEDILNQYFKEKLEETIPVRTDSPEADERLWLSNFLHLVSSHAHIIKLIAKNEKLAKTCMKFLINEIQTFLFQEFDVNLDDPQMLYAIYYHCSGIVYVLMHWIETGQKESIEEMENIIYACASDQTRFARKHNKEEIS